MELEYRSDRLRINIDTDTGEGTASALGITDPIQEAMFNGVAIGVMHAVVTRSSTIVPANEQGLTMLAHMIYEVWDDMAT